MVAVSTLRHQCRTKALLIALSYNSRKGVPSLATTHADLDRLAQHLVEYWGYCPQCITKMRDGEGDAALRPTKENILREIENLVRDVETGDRRVFYFAGHCYQIVNHRGTEIDDLDEVILVDGDCDPTPLIPEEDGTCLDFSKIQPKERQMILHGVIIDNELRRHLVDRIPLGAKLVAISNTCHSGTLFDLDYHWQDEDSSLSQVRTLIRPGILPRAWMRRKRSSKAVHAQVGKKAMDVRRREEVVFSMKSSGMQSPKRGRSQTIKPMFASKDFIGFYNNGDEPWFKDREPCLSPSWEDMPEVISIASSYDSQSTMSGKKSMTVVLIEILERRKQKPIRTRKLNHQLNCEMRDLRCELMHKHWTENKRSMSFIQKALRTLRRVQQPVIGSLSPDTPEKIFEF